ncbi:MAG: trypsin-like peptidase domain-containing protein [Vicinamibacterales bacterium]
MNADQRRSFFLLLVFGLSAGLSAAQSPDERAAARDIIKKWQYTVVNVRIVLKTRMAMGGREMQATEETVDAVATVIEPDGLAVMSLSTLNPAGMMSRIMGQAGGGEDKFQMTSEPTDLKIRLSDGREIPAKIVLRDEDLDLAFIRPTAKPDTPFTSLALSDEGRPQPLDPVVTISRLGRVGGWVPAASLQSIQAIIERPRRMYVISASDGLGGGIGTPVFLLNGKLAGLLVLRSMSGNRPGMFSMMGGSEGLGLLPVILPAADVREVAKQAVEK